MLDPLGYRKTTCSASPCKSLIRCKVPLSLLLRCPLSHWPVPVDPCGCCSLLCTPSCHLSLICWDLSPLALGSRSWSCSQGAGLLGGTPGLTGPPLPSCSLATQYSLSLASQPTREGKSLPHPAQSGWGRLRSLPGGSPGEKLQPEVPCTPSTARTHSDQPPGAHHRGGGPRRQGGLFSRASPSLHPLRPLSTCNSPAAEVTGQPLPPAPSMLLLSPECLSGPLPKSCCLSVSASCSPSMRVPPGFVPVHTIKALPEVQCLV